MTHEDLVFQDFVVTGSPDLDGRCFTGTTFDDLGDPGDLVKPVWKSWLDPEADTGFDFSVDVIYAPRSPDVSAPLIRIGDDPARSADRGYPIECGTFEHRAEVPVSFACIDPGGVDPDPTCTSNMPSGQLDTSTIGTHQLTVTARDASGNERSRTVTYFVVDSQAPDAAPVQSPAPSADGWTYGNVSVEWNWSDASTGVDPERCTTHSSPTRVGPQVLTATCIDQAGNTGSAELELKVRTAPLPAATTNRVVLLGDAPEPLRALPSLPAAATRWDAVAAGGSFALAITDTGDLVSWGTEPSSGSPMSPPPLSDTASRWTAVAAAYSHALALDDAGKIARWGYRYEDTSPSLSDGATGWTAIAAGGFNLALDDRGAISSWSNSNVPPPAIPSVPEGATRWTAIAAGSGHGLALTDNGEVSVWGDQTMVPDLPGGATRWASIAAFGGQNLALSDTGTMVAWGASTVVPTLPQGATRWTTVAAGGTANTAITDDGQLVMWTSTTTTQPAPPTGGVRWTAVSGGGTYGIALVDIANPTTMSVTSTPDAVTVGDALTFRAVVTPALATAQARGTVTFTSGAANLGTCTLTAGACTLTDDSLAAGHHTVVASYSGDRDNLPSTAQLTQVIERGPQILVITGFNAPVESTEGAWNAVKAGRTVPLKFEVFDASTDVELTDIAVIREFDIRRVTCPTSNEAENTEATTLEHTTLRYDSDAGQFIQNWRTPKVRGCYAATVTTTAGTSISANFRLT